MNKKEKDYIQGYKDAVELVEIVTESTAQLLINKALDRDDAMDIVDRYISLTYVLKFAVEQMQSDYDDSPECDEDCEKCMHNSIEEDFASFVKMLKEEI